MCLLIGWLAAGGCQEASLSAVSATKTAAVSSGSSGPCGSFSQTIDAGIVLADRVGYFCLSLEQVGLPLDSEIVSLKSSCDCVQPRLVQYVADRHRISQAILLEYIAEVSSSGNLGEDTVREVQPANLGVIVEVGLADGAKQNFTINLLYTTLYRKELLSSAAEVRSQNRRDRSELSGEGAL